MSMGAGMDSSLADLRRRSSVATATINHNSLGMDPGDHIPVRSCRTSSLALPGPNERALLDLLVREQPLLQPMSVSPHISSANQLPRRHSAHCCPPEHTPQMISSQPPPIPLRPPAVPERNKIGLPPQISGFNPNHSYQSLATKTPIPPPPQSQSLQKSIQAPVAGPHNHKSHLNMPTPIKNSNLPSSQLPTVIKQKTNKVKIPPPLPPQSHIAPLPAQAHITAPPPLKPVPTQHIPQQPMKQMLNHTPVLASMNQQPTLVNKQPSPIPTQTQQPRLTDCLEQITPPTQQSNNNNNNGNNNNNNNNKISVRQDSNVSSDSFSQNSSPSYTTKTMETPLLPHHGLSTKGQYHKASVKNVLGGHNDSQAETDNSAGSDGSGNGNSALTKSISTPASLQTIVRFHSGSNMSLHHRIIRDMRRPSTHYITRGRLRFRFAQVLINAVALLAIAGGLAAYFRAYPSTVRYVNKTLTTTTVAVIPQEGTNPAPGICLPVIVSFCHYHKVPYNFTMFPNYMGHFTQRDAQQELEVYDAVVDVRCYELAALFLCSVFVPKCGPSGQLVRPCRSLCFETKRRCGFFLDVFGLSLPEYLDCDLFPEAPDPDVCVGHHEVIEAEIRAQNPVCISGYQCDVKRCIPSDWRCDGHVDCEDQSDELDCDQCASGMIHCGEKRCISQSHMCDGVVDCPWGQDERNCLRLSEMGDVGRGQLEVFHPEDRSWKPACVTHWDPATSANTICSLLGYTTANSSGLTLKGSDVTLAPPVNSSPNVWKLMQQKQSNLLKELKTCPTANHPTVELSCFHFACGKRRDHVMKPSTRIVGGVESSPGDWPFLAAILGGPEEVFYCAGVLIADQWVLTASHCVGNLSQADPSGWTIQLGITRRHAHSYYGQKMKVRRVVPHPMYNLGVAHDNDVALFQLESRVKFHEHLLPVCLPPANHDLVPGTECTVIGWGKKEDKEISEYESAVNEVKVPVLNRDLCNAWLEHRDLNVTEGMICAGYAEGGKDACQGDSGGPLLCRDKKHQDRWFVGGIVSWGIKCAHPQLPGVYAYVPRYVPWITQQMALYSD